MPKSESDASVYKTLELETKVANASPHTLIKMLFEELTLQLARVRAADSRDDVKLRNAAVERAINIISYLHATLSDEGDSELPHNLALLYEYMIRQLLSFRLRGDITLLEEVLTLVETIASAWRDIIDTSKP